ncbi:MAG: helix-turn-helix domain-containing protein [Candidatus Thorarchaeota archaeon]|nr:MAG: TrmB family transcriptional regulator [Candidatus Thorarchaeota archaeon]RLI60026.1 MAG: TrmB family transcriptional regulator [Candidatus Thorarchaeota archaeon]
MTAEKSIVSLFDRSFEKPSDLLCCAFGLRNTELDVYFTLLGNSLTVEQVAAELGKERSVIQRTLTKLLAKGLISRKKQQRERHLERGGYYYEYHAISRDVVRERILEQLDEWYRTTRRFLLERWSDGLQHTSS